MQRRHVVFLDQYGSLGGGQQVLLELVRAALALGHGVSVLLPDGPCADKLRAQGANVVAIAAPACSQGTKGLGDILKLLFWNSAVFLRHARLLARCDLVYVNGLRLLPVAMLAQRFLRRTAACHVHLHHGARELGLVRRFLQHPRTRAVIVPSPFIQRQLVSFDAAFADARVRLVENGLDARFADVPFTDRFTGRELRHVAIVGRVSPEKGQDVLPELARQFPELTFHVLGDAAFAAQAFATRVRAACPANVVWHGWIDDLPNKVSELGIQVALVPSRVAEAFSLVCCEMVALSCVILVRRLGALEDVAKQLGGFSFRQDTEVPLLLRQLQNAKLAQVVRGVHQSHRIVCNNFGNAVFRQRVADLFNSL